MKHLSELTLVNFQSHARSTLSFVPGLNVIVGPSDSGKTATIRGIRWATKNYPTGGAFRRLGTNGVQVQLNFSDGQQIVRQREKNGANRYMANEQLFEGFGTGVPLEVIEAHGMPDIVIGDFKTSLNIAFQLEPAFLLGTSGPIAAKILGKLAGTEVVDTAMKDLNGDLYRSWQEKVRTERQLEDTKQELGNYAYLPELAVKIERLTALDKQISAAGALKSQLMSLQNKLLLVNAQISQTSGILAKLAGVFEAEERARESTEAQELTTRLTGLASDHQRNSHAVTETEAIVKRTEQVGQAGEIVLTAGNKISELSRLRTAEETHGNVTTGITSIQQLLETLVQVPEAETLLSQCTSNLNSHLQLVNLTERALSVTSGINHLQEALEALGDVPKVEVLISESTGNLDKFGQLSRMSLQLVMLNENITGRKSGLEKLNKIGETEQRVERVEKALQTSGVLQSTATRWTQSRIIDFDLTLDLQHANQEQQSAIQDLETAIRQLGTCPTCMTPITDSVITNIIEEMR